MTDFTISFKTEHIIYEHIVKCRVKEREFLLSTNPTLIDNNTKELYEFTKDESFQPYVTTIGLYNSNKELMMVAKMNQPIPLSKYTDTIFEIHYDS